MQKFNKLVRDKIPDIIRANGEVPMTYVADDEEYYQRLKQKLQEEIDEFIAEDNIEELADVLEVIYALCDVQNVRRVDLEQIRQIKEDKRGGFKEKIILKSTQ
ncbi:MAG: nucleoside triphosphate pyrophosphohydrolase [Patescibacteria group bacterium]